ncbi:MAG TPA: phosphotransferase [Legionella sp.]|nr:phosphotransferase [Legionella sp.]
MKTNLINEHRILDSNLLDTITHILNKKFAAEVTISSTQFLSEPERRNCLVRLFLSSQTKEIPASIILKQSLREDTDADDEDAYARFARDWAGLEFASEIKQNKHNVPKFFGGDKENRFILIEDLGMQHVSLVDSLTRADRKNAIAALTRFMKALGSFHAASFGNTALYEQILQSVHPEAETIDDELSFAFNDLLPKLDLANKNLGLTLTKECIEEAKSLIEYTIKPELFTVLTHGDICPDNVFDHADTKDLQLIDFEWCVVRNPLLDGTYLRMSMPTCWCAKAIPTDVIEHLEYIYREELKQTIPEAADDQQYNKAYTYACGFWLLQQTIPFINSTREQDRIGPSGPVPKDSFWSDEENWVRPRVLSRLQAFIECSSVHQHLPHLQQMALAMLTELKQCWPETSFLKFYPAFGQG